MKEIETAYRVNARDVPDLGNVPYKDIEQVYFTPAEHDPNYPETAHAEWRIRKTTDMYGDTKLSTTVKFGDKRSGSRVELESGITESAFGVDPEEQEDFVYGIVRKRRYDLGDALVLDVYDPEYHGDLMLAEKEFESQAEQAAWVAPDWCLEADDIPSNRMLAQPLHPTPRKREAGEVQAYTPDEMRAFLLHAQNSSGRVLVTVSGISGSGKSTFARQLAADLDAPIVETDNLHIGAAKLLEQYSEVNHDLPHAYDYAYAGHAALRLALGNAVDVPLYDYESAEPTGKTMRIDPTGSGSVVVDGLFASQTPLPETDEEIAVHHVLVDTPLYVSVIRRLLRDAVVREAICERPVQFTPEESLRYIVATALPTYLQHQDTSSFDYAVR